MAEIEAKKQAELDLSIQNLLLSMPNPIAYITVDQNCTYVNREFERVYGRTLHQIRESPLSELFDEQVIRFIEKTFAHFQNEPYLNEQTKFVLQRNMASGHRFEFFPRHDKDNRLQGLFIHSHDEANFRKPCDPTYQGEHFDTGPYHSNESLLKASRPVGLGFWSMDMVTTLVTISDKLTTDWAILSEDFSETMDQCIDRIYVEDQAMVRRAFRATMEGRQDYGVEYRILTPDNEFVWIESRAEMIRDENGVPLRLVGTVHDITNRKNLERVLRESENRFRTLADFIPQIVWTTNAQGKMDYCNRNGLNFAGMSLDQALKGDVLLVIHPDDLIKARPIWADAIAHGYPFELELRLLRAVDQTYRWHLTRGLALSDEKGIKVKWLGTSTDIHEQKRMLEDLRMATLQAEKGMATKSAFIANMSHEIRTPLTAILGFTKLLENPNISAEVKANYFQIIDHNGKALTKIIDDILDISKFEAGKFKIESIAFSLSALLTEVVSMFEKAALEKEVKIVLNLDQVECEPIRTDPSRLRQILINILGNATKFTDHGTIHIEASTRLIGDSGVHLQVLIEDTGLGLSEEQAKHLFEPFSQADESTTRKFGGSGLGLTLSRRFARALGGDVSLVKYAPGKGCTFLISALAETIANDLHFVAIEPISNPKSGPVPPLRTGLKGLVVDDALENQFLLSEILAEKGIKVSLASNGREAIDKAMDWDPDFILMDMQMPILDGYSATTELRKLGYKKPIIALTAMALKEDEARIIASGCDIHLTKPIDFKSLFDTVAFFTENKLRSV